MASQAGAVVPKKGFLMVVLTEGTTHSNKATKANLDSWIGSAKAPYTTTLDADPPQKDLEAFFGTDRDTAVLVDLKTMKVVQIIRNNATRALTELNKLLDQ
jgi:hypothetical protein